MRVLFCGLLRCLVVALYLSPTYADTFTVTTSTSIRNDNWYPLPEAEMKAAAVDTALAEFTNNGRFEIIADSPAAEQSLDGQLLFTIALVGPAQVVKLTTSLTLKNQPTYVSTVSMDIHGLGYRGIYDAFEYVGTEAAKRLNAKIKLLEVAVVAAPVQPAPVADTPTHNAAGVANPEILTLFNQAQELKRKEQFHQARVLFEQVVALSAAAEQRWKGMAEDELSFGLPIFEADNLMLNNTVQDPLKLQQKMLAVTHLYRQILAVNANKPERVVEMNRRLDQVAITQKHMANAIKSSAMARVNPLRVILAEHYMEMGAWPGQARMAEMIPQFIPHMELLNYEIKGQRLEIVVNDKKYAVEILLSAGMEGMGMDIDLEVK